MQNIYPNRLKYLCKIFITINVKCVCQILTPHWPPPLICFHHLVLSMCSWPFSCSIIVELSWFRWWSLDGGFGDHYDQCRESFLFSPAAVEWHLLSESGMENLIVIKIISRKIGHLIILSSFSVWWRHYWGFIDQEPIHTSTYQLRQNIFFHIISPSSQHCSSVSNSWESTTRNISRHLWGSWTASLMWHIWAVFVIKRPLKYRKNPKIRSVAGLHYITLRCQKIIFNFFFYIFKVERFF